MNVMLLNEIIKGLEKGYYPKIIGKIDKDKDGNLTCKISSEHNKDLKTLGTDLVTQINEVWGDAIKEIENNKNNKEKKPNIDLNNIKKDVKKYNNEFIKNILMKKIQ